MKITKKLIKGYVKDKLANDEIWQLQALRKIYEFQTPNEQDSELTSVHNDVGFTGVDGTILTSIGKQLNNKGFISNKQKAIVAKKMKKYWKQILNISDHKKLIRCMIKDGVISEKDAFVDCIEKL